MGSVCAECLRRAGQQSHHLYAQHAREGGRGERQFRRGEVGGGRQRCADQCQHVDDQQSRGAHQRPGAKAAAPEGMLVDQFSSNVDVTQSPQPMKNYLPVGPRDTNNALQTISYPYNTRAFVQTRCSFDGDAAGQTLAHRVAVRDSSVHFGPQAYLGSTTPGANITVQDFNSDFFELVAYVPYDFGVYFLPTPKNGTGNDRCSIMVMVFRP